MARTYKIIKTLRMNGFDNTDIFYLINGCVLYPEKIKEMKSLEEVLIFVRTNKIELTEAKDTDITEVVAFLEKLTHVNDANTKGEVTYFDAREDWAFVINEETKEKNNKNKTGTIILFIILAVALSPIIPFIIPILGCWVLFMGILWLCDKFHL